MAILETVTTPAPVAAINVRRGAFPVGVTFDRPRAKVWGNVALVIGGELVTLPLGLAIDTMEPASVTGQNVEVVKRNAMKNRVLEAMQKMGAKMAPGETKVIGDASVEGNLVFQLRRVNEDLELVPTKDELDVEGIVDLLNGKGPEEKLKAKLVEEALARDVGDPGESKEQIKAHIKALQAALKVAK